MHPTVSRTIRPRRAFAVAGLAAGALALGAGALALQSGAGVAPPDRPPYVVAEDGAVEPALVPQVDADGRVVSLVPTACILDPPPPGAEPRPECADVPVAFPNPHLQIVEEESAGGP